MKKKSAILPYRFNEGELEILLIKNTRNTKWVIPKGTIEVPLQPAASAAKEAYEEAGVLGIPTPIMIGTYRKNQQEVPTFLLEVDYVMKHYEEEGMRKRCWHKPEDITDFVVDEDLKKLINKGVKIIQKNGHYFKHAVEYFIRETEIISPKISKKKAHLIYPLSSLKSKTVLLKRNKTNIEFLVPSRFSFESLEQVPDQLAKQILLQNSKNKMGSWALKKNGQKYVLYRVRSEKLKALNTIEFLSILKNLCSSCNAFDKAHRTNKLTNLSKKN